MKGQERKGNKGKTLRRGMGLTTVLLALLLVAGCGAKPAAPEENTAEAASSASSEAASSSEETSAESEAESTSSVSQSAEEADSASTSQTEDANSSSSESTSDASSAESSSSSASSAQELVSDPVLPPAAEVVFDPYYTEDNKEMADILGLNSSGAVQWHVHTDSYPATELVQCEAIGPYGEAYYYVEGGKVVALNLRDGKKLWENKDFGGASPSGVFDESGKLYLCGFYRPDLFVVDRRGHTVTREELFDQNYNYPDEITLQDDKITIHYASNNGTLDIDRKDYKVISNIAPAAGYSDEELIEMAKKYSGYTDAEVEIREKSEEEILLHVYYDYPDEIETIMWYWIDPRTGQGEDVNGNLVDFRDVL